MKTRPVRSFVMENIGEPLSCGAENSGLSISLIQSKFCGNNETTLTVYSTTNYIQSIILNQHLVGFVQGGPSPTILL